MARSRQPPTPVRTTSPPASSREAAAEFARDVQRRGGVVVFTNGVFDLLHPGHVRYLTEARRLGDALIVGINSDRSVRANKGPERPINRAEERAEILVWVWRASMLRQYSTKTHPSRSSRRFSPTFWSRERTGARTTSWGATLLKREAVAWSASISPKDFRRRI